MKKQKDFLEIIDIGCENVIDMNNTKNNISHDKSVFINVRKSHLNILKKTVLLLFFIIMSFLIYKYKK